MKTNKGGLRRLQIIGLVVVTVLVLGVPSTASEVVPSSCKVHKVKILNPGCIPALTESLAGADETYPDLRPNAVDVFMQPKLVWDEPSQTWMDEGPHLWFDTHAENVGYFPMELLVEDLEVAETSPVTQCISWTAGYVCTERREVGGFEWHEAHEHFHYRDFAEYELRQVLPDGRPDYSATGLVRASEKVSFCLVDSQTNRLTPPSPPTYPQVCTATRQGISPGWTDVYTSDLPGQQFNLQGVSDGRYALVISIDPPGRLYETDRSNNRVEITLDIGGNLTTATIVDRAWQ